MSSAKGFFSLFILFSILYSGSILFDSETLVFYLKPLLLPPLIIAVLISKNFQFTFILAAALLFSWIGDMLLLFVFKDSIYFILGLIAFLIAHIFYIALFTKELKKRNPTIKLRKAVLLPVVIYLTTMLSILIPHLGSLTIPVIIYAIAISTMLYLAGLLSFYWSKPASTYLITGAISFIVSDSILAFNKFYQPVPMSGFLIMASYLYAQGALVRSCTRQE